jgi:hypothetical protein
LSGTGNISAAIPYLILTVRSTEEVEQEQDLSPVSRSEVDPVFIMGDDNDGDDDDDEVPRGKVEHKARSFLEAL